jgi:hypothetical protein
MGQIFEIILWMWIIAIVSFAPLGYFIYLFTIGDGEKFGKSNPEDHSVEHKSYYHLVNNILGKILGESGSQSLGSAARQRPATKKTAVAAMSSTERYIASKQAAKPAKPLSSTERYIAAKARAAKK